MSYDPRPGNLNVQPVARPARIPIIGYNGIVQPDVWPPIDRPVTLTPLVPPWISNPPDPIRCDSRRQLFVDDFLIESTTMTRTFYRPTQYGGNPVLTPSGTVLSFPFSDGAWLDPADNTWKMDYFYDDQTTARAHSVDGKVWTKPNFGLFGSPTNATLQLGGAFGRDSSTTWMDLNDIAARKWKMVQNQYTIAASPRDNHLVLYYSSDGVNWGVPVATSGNLGPLSDRNTFFYNPFRAKWVLSLRDIVAAVGRCRRYLEGSDLAAMITGLTDVSAQAFWTGADTLDPSLAGSDLPFPSLYTVDGIGYESIMLFLLTIIDKKSGPDGLEVNNVELATSRDGFYLDRTSRLHLADGTGNPANWNEGNVQSVGGAVVDVGDETWMYTSGRTSAADTAGLWIWRKGRFASLDAGGVEAQTTGRWQVPTGSPTQFFVNANAAGGSLKVEFLDGGGQVISAFSKANCNAVAVDSTDVQVTWAGAPSLSAIAGQRIKPRFYGTNAKISGYRYA
jgi:hypothetical protein